MPLSSLEWKIKFHLASRSSPEKAESKDNKNEKDRGINSFYIGVIALIVIITSMLSGCSDEVDPWEVFCESDTCWDVSGVDYIYVNDFPNVGRVPPNKSHGGRFAATKGRTYSVITRVTSGSCHTYVSPHFIIGPIHNQLTDYYSNDNITFTAEEGLYYILMADTGRGCEYSARVISYDENRAPLPGTTYLTVNGGPLSYRLIPDENLRFAFNGIRGHDYTIRVAVFYGMDDTFLSLIPSVDKDVYELSDLYSDSGILFRAAESTKYYIAVADRGMPTGSDVTIEVTSP